MNEAPKKIWMSDFVDWEECFAEYEQDTQYIRADLVDGLVEALGELYEVAKNVDDEGPLGEGWQSDWLIEELRKARAALKALDEEAVDYEPAEPREGSAHLMEK